MLVNRGMAGCTAETMQPFKRMSQMHNYCTAQVSKRTTSRVEKQAPGKCIQCGTRLFLKNQNQPLLEVCSWLKMRLWIHRRLSRLLGLHLGTSARIGAAEVGKSGTGSKWARLCQLLFSWNGSLEENLLWLFSEPRVPPLQQPFEVPQRLSLPHHILPISHSLGIQSWWMRRRG